MSKGRFSIKFFGLSMLYLTIAIVLKVLFAYNIIDIVYLDFISGIFTPPIAFYIIVAFDTKKHVWNKLLLFILCFLIFYAIIVNNYNSVLLSKLLGIVFGGLLCSMTFITRIKNWLMKK